MLRWIQSFLSGRFQKVVHNDKFKESNPCSDLSGVLQGSVLGLYSRLIMPNILECL